MAPKFILTVYDIEDPHVIFFLVAIDQLEHGRWGCSCPGSRAGGRSSAVGSEAARRAP